MPVTSWKREAILWSDFVSRVSMRNAAIPAQLSVRLGMDGPPQLAVTIRVGHRDTGEEISVGQVTHLPTFRDAESAARLVFTTIRDMYVHEAEEAFHLDGVRIFDPHARDLTARR